MCCTLVLYLQSLGRLGCFSLGMIAYIQLQSLSRLVLDMLAYTLAKPWQAVVFHVVRTPNKLQKTSQKINFEIDFWPAKTI